MINWNQKKQNALVAYLLFFIWPFLSLVYALFNYRSAFAKNIVWLFCGWYGYTLVLFNDCDAYRYRDLFIRLNNLDLSFGHFWSLVRQGVGANPQLSRGDYVEPLLSYFTTFIADDFRIYFTVQGLFIGYFLSRNIWLIINSQKLKNLSIPFLIAFFLTCPIWYMTGFRFYAAVHVFIFGLLNYTIRDKSWKYLIFSVGTIFVHIGFLYPVGVLIGFLILGKRKYLYLIFVVIAIFFSNINISKIISFIPQTTNNSSLDNRFEAIAYEGAIENYHDKTQSSWFKKIERNMYGFSTLALIGLVFFFGSKKIQNTSMENIFYFGLLLGGATFALKLIPSVARFYTLSTMCLLVVVIRMIQENKNSYWFNKFSFIIYAFLLFSGVMSLRTGIDSMNIALFISNPVIAPMFDNTTAMEYIILWYK